MTSIRTQFIMKGASMRKERHEERRSSAEDRRSGFDRRLINSSGLVFSGDINRRKNKEDRRSPGEQRTGYARLGQWNSVLLGINVVS